MVETYVRLLCPECAKDWETAPDDLPGAGDTFHCPNCHASRPTAEFMRTDHDLSTLKQLG
ncbi:hypothetical protein G9C85_04530 [Halorubellus sp. JP-L1]|uniref:DUF7836 family putative zinc-binding protein n=1 Tax=Halorubellus sp. JP-L1 TaxID=2715753 RepID=UPI00140AACC3|nr:hypothetical protein [Halorubellus sp. JP-L1]NHN40901.1 hypothetical protein [Halorubellus sp. JP-L1]